MKKIFAVLAIVGLMFAASACGCTDNVKEPAAEETAIDSTALFPVVDTVAAEAVEAVEAPETQAE